MTKGSNTYQRRVASVIAQIVKSTNTYMGCCKREYKPWVTKSFALGVTANDVPNWIRARITSATEMVASATPKMVATFIWFTPESCEGESLHALVGRVLRLSMIAVIDGNLNSAIHATCPTLDRFTATRYISSYRLELDRQEDDCPASEYETRSSRGTAKAHGDN